MNTFQWIVVPGALLLATHEFATWLRGGKRIGLARVLVWLCFAGAVYQPDMIQRLANAASIGRGADLLLYALAVFVLLTTFHFMNQLEEQRRQLTLLVREIALSRPTWPVGNVSEQREEEP